jgi:hypothetical protein
VHDFSVANILGTETKLSVRLAGSNSPSPPSARKSRRFSTMTSTTPPTIEAVRHSLSTDQHGSTNFTFISCTTYFNSTRI